MTKYIRYLRYLIRYKYYVGIELFKHKLFYRALIHDISKFFPSEFIPCAKWFYGETNTQDIVSYDMACLKHHNKNSHHWQYWILRHDDGHTTTSPMPNKLVKEMVSGWIGNGKAISKAGIEDTLTWYEINKSNMILHSATRSQVRRLLGVLPQKRTKVNNQVKVGTEYNYTTGYDNEITVVEGTLTPQQIRENDAEKQRRKMDATDIEVDDVEVQKDDTTPQSEKANNGI